jgi:hypothetical protein
MLMPAQREAANGYQWHATANGHVNTNAGTFQRQWPFRQRPTPDQDDKSVDSNANGGDEDQEWRSITTTFKG